LFTPACAYGKVWRAGSSARRTIGRGINMASLYEFDTTSTIQSHKYPTSASALGKVGKALAGKKIPKPQVDKFLDELKKFNFSKIVMTAQLYIGKNMVAKGLAPMTTNPNILQKALLVALFGPQKKVLKAKFNLSVHLKGTGIELHYTDCKGGKKILFSVAP
jgi:hypothetical protein